MIMCVYTYEFFRNKLGFGEINQYLIRDFVIFQIKVNKLPAILVLETILGTL